jgi:ABC-type iron transport system FetAB ATPase subunit
VRRFGELDTQLFDSVVEGDVEYWHQYRTDKRDRARMEFVVAKAHNNEPMIPNEIADLTGVQLPEVENAIERAENQLRELLAEYANPESY